MHENQKNDDGSAAPKIKRDAYYQGKKDAVDAKVAGYPAWAAANPADAAKTMTLKFGAPIFAHFTGGTAEVAKEDSLAAISRGGNTGPAPGVPNILETPDPASSGCSEPILRRRTQGVAGGFKPVIRRRPPRTSKNPQELTLTASLRQVVDAGLNPREFAGQCRSLSRHREVTSENTLRAPTRIWVPPAALEETAVTPIHPRR